jgi:putative transcriptional regulator
MPESDLGPPGQPRAIETLLAGYVAGALQPHLHALIESHLILSEENRPFVRALEKAAGDELEATAPAKPLGRAARDQVLAAIYAGGWYGAPRPRKHDPDVPEPLDKLVGMALKDVPWRFKAPGLSSHVLHRSGGLTAALYRIGAGRRFPAHTHEGLEITLVLKGGFSDQAGHHLRGDVAIADPSVDHRPRADPGEPCVCFAVTDAPLRLTGPLGRLIQKAFGR